MPFKKTNFFPLYVEYVDEIFNPHPHILHMRIIRLFRIFRIRMANPNTNTKEVSKNKFKRGEQYKYILLTQIQMWDEKTNTNMV